MIKFNFEISQEMLFDNSNVNESDDFNIKLP